MRLKKAQKEKLLELVAQGLETGEINSQAVLFDPPFSVSRQQVDFYRKSRNAELKAIKSISENAAMVEGYALKEHRVYKLSLLAALMEQDLFGGFVWLDQVKGVGSGDIAEIVEYEEFNASEIVQYRGVLDDIARETGGRVQKGELTGENGGAIVVRVEYVGNDNEPQSA